MTTINVPRELLEQVITELEPSGDPHWLAQELRALLAEQPQDGAGQSGAAVEAFCGCRIVHSQKNGDILVQCTQHVAAQPPARHEQGDEVRRLREALTELRDTMRLYFPGENPAGHKALMERADAALTHSQQGAEE